MAARDYLQRFWPYFAIAGMVVILLGASVFIVETLPPRTISDGDRCRGRCLLRGEHPLP